MCALVSCESNLISHFLPVREDVFTFRCTPGSAHQKNTFCPVSVAQHHRALDTENERVRSVSVGVVISLQYYEHFAIFNLIDLT